MAGRMDAARWRRLATALVLVGSCAVARDARGDGVAMVLNAKTIPAATVAVIDPESGTSSGTGTTDVRLSAGDIILFHYDFLPVPNGQIHGLNGWLTEFVPPNTEVVGARLIDAAGNTIRPRLPGIATDGCGRTCNGFDSVPSSTGPRNLADGSIAQLYADTGIFYSTDARTNRDPATAFLTLSNGIAMIPPQRVGDVDGILGTSAPYYAHQAWDYVQVRAYGISNPSGNASGNNGTGNTPYLYGSPVAGPQTHFRYEATETSPGVVRFDDVVGPWQRLRIPGSLIGTGAPATGRGGPLVRMVSDASGLGYDVRPANPLPPSTRALRYAVGEVRVGEPIRAEVALRVLGTPIDNVQMQDVNCAETFGGDTSARSSTGRAEDNSWSVYLGSPACVYLNLLFDLTSDRPLAVTGDNVTFSLRTKNLSTLRQTGAVIRQKFDSSRMAFVRVEPGTPMPAIVGNCDGDGLDCLVWPARSFEPSEEVTYQTVFGVGGGGQVTHVMRADYRSATLPAPGFRTQTINMIRPIGVVTASLASTTPAAMPGGTASFSGSVGVTGTSGVSFDETIVGLPAGWTVRDSNGDSIPDVRLGGVVVNCSAACATNRPEFNLAAAIAAGATRTLTFTANVPGGTATGLYPVDLSVWASQTGYGGRYETYFDDLAVQAVGALRSDRPVLDCPIVSTQTRIAGSTTEAGGTVIRLYFNAIQRGSGASAASRFDIGTFGGGSTFGELYGGLEVRATAQAPGELESELSVACFVTGTTQCADGLDNDGDGLIDFPADPGCSSAGDRDEGAVQCSDGLDNDGDGLVDFPDDPECSGPDDPTEAGPAACGDGIDNDGDGATDFPADACCTSAADRREGCYRACGDFVDNDADTRVDFPTDLGCHSGNDDDERDLPPSDRVDARLLVVFDTSGSMNWNTCAAQFTGGDGSTECPGADVACATCTSSSCGDGTANDSRIDKAKRGLSNVIAAYGEVEYGLMRFHQRPMPFGCPTSNASARSGGWQGAGAAPCGGGFASGDLLVSFGHENQLDMLEWMDGSSSYAGSNPPPGLDTELRGTGTTPIAGSLASARTYLTSTAGGDVAASCRPYRVILITDGQETCGGDPVAAAGALRTAGFPTYVIGFAVADAGAVGDLNAIAAAGGTTSAIFVDDETTLSTAIADIIGETVLVEVCNGLDDDCDGLTDEGFPLFCDRPSGVSTPTLCADPGETVCDGVDDNCNGLVDEGLLNACGLCGPTPVETCNRLDDDCDGAIDEGGVCMGCIPEPEICDGVDNDCDGVIDELVTRPCGTDVGECSTGLETCTLGAWGGCTAVGPTPETCNGLDDDCDGVTDGLSRACGTATGACSPGAQVCVAGAWGSCVGAVGPAPEICDTVDNDCDGMADEGNPGGGGACGSAIGTCLRGTLACTGGALVCVGGVGPAPETCNGLDDDCNGVVDDGVPTAGACGNGTGECRQGVSTCVGGAFTCVGGRGPVAEVCDGRDNDCDGSTDEGDPGGGAACGSSVGACSEGRTTCVMGAFACVGGTAPIAELCNGADDDCDGLTDEGNPEGGGACGATDVGECDFGALRCELGALVCRGETTPEPELCDGLDNDCDGSTDEGNPEGGAACGDDTGECAAGTTLCSMGSLVCDGAIGPTPEVCNALDDDCDGVIDDGIPVGAACGSDVGECSPGINVCMGGAIVCDGAVGPTPEVCNALDDDCDGAIDEGLPLGMTCGSSVGLCMEGMEQCIDGRVVCVGEVTPDVEACDCEDNDCDGETDEPPGTGTLCPPGTMCLDCSCALPCVVTEFAPPCPSGRVPVDRDGECWCVAERCRPETCGLETIERGELTLCAPDTSGVPSCVCRANECTFPCDGVACPGGTVCHPLTGGCVEDNCRGLGCPEGELCDVMTLECVDDPCATATCGPTEACRAGACETSCASLACGPTERCERGACVDDPCYAARCSGGMVCDRASGECVENRCAGVLCPGGEICDPTMGSCLADPCTPLRCPEGEYCVAGECAPDVPGTPDGGPGADGGSRIDGGPPDEWILAAGGGGCHCDAAGTGRAPGALPEALALLVLLVVRRRRRR